MRGMFSVDCHVWGDPSPGNVRYRRAERAGARSRIGRRAASHASGVRPSLMLTLLREAATELPRLAADVEARFHRGNGYANIVRQIRALIEQRARQVLVSLEAELPTTD